MNMTISYEPLGPRNEETYNQFGFVNNDKESQKTATLGLSYINNSSEVEVDHPSYVSRANLHQIQSKEIVANEKDKQVFALSCYPLKKNSSKPLLTKEDISLFDEATSIQNESISDDNFVELCLGLLEKIDSPKVNEKLRIIKELDVSSEYPEILRELKAVCKSLGESGGLEAAAGEALMSAMGGHTTKRTLRINYYKVVNHGKLKNKLSDQIKLSRSQIESKLLINDSKLSQHISSLEEESKIALYAAIVSNDEHAIADILLNGTDYADKSLLLGICRRDTQDGFEEFLSPTQKALIQRILKSPDGNPLTSDAIKRIATQAMTKIPDPMVSVRSKYLINLSIGVDDLALKKAIYLHFSEPVKILEENKFKGKVKLGEFLAAIKSKKLDDSEFIFLALGLLQGKIDGSEELSGDLNRIRKLYVDTSFEEAIKEICSFVQTNHEVLDNDVSQTILECSEKYAGLNLKEYVLNCYNSILNRLDERKKSEPDSVTKWDAKRLLLTELETLIEDGDYIKATRHIEYLCKYSKTQQVLGPDCAKSLLEKGLAEVDVRYNFSRRFLENRMAALHLGDKATLNGKLKSINKIGEHFLGNDIKPATCIDEAMLTIISIPEISMRDDLVKLRFKIRDNISHFDGKFRTTRSGYSTKEQEGQEISKLERFGRYEELEKEAITTFSRNTGMMRSMQPNFSDELTDAPLLNRVPDIAESGHLNMPMAIREAYASIYKRSSYGGDLSGHTVVAATLLYDYAVAHKDDPELNEDINAFLNAWVATYVSQGFHSYLECVHILEAPITHELFESVGVQLDIGLSPLKLEQAFKDTQEYVKVYALRRAMQEELKSKISLV